MTLVRVVLLTVVLHFVSTGVLSATVETSQSNSQLNHSATNVDNGVNSKRPLRLSKAPHENEDITSENKSIEEEKGYPISALLSKISKKITIKTKLNWWESLGKSENYVKKKLGLENLKGSALEANSNFPHYLKYVNDVEAFTLYRKTDGYSTYSVWKKLGLDKITTVKQLDEIRHTNEYRIYKRYVRLFDDNLIETVSLGSPYYMYAPDYADKAATSMEKLARAELWGKSHRTENYAKMVLGLTHAKEGKLQQNEFYQHFLTIYEKYKNLPKHDAAEDKAALKAIILSSENWQPTKKILGW